MNSDSCSRRGKRTTVWGQVRPRSGQQPYRIQILHGRRWVSAGTTKLTTRGGFLRRVVVAERGSRLRVWSPRDRRYSLTLTVR